MVTIFQEFWHVVDMQMLLNKWIRFPSTSISPTNLFFIKIRSKVVASFTSFTFLEMKIR